MINTYNDKKNPCVLCIDTLNHDSVNIKKDYLEFSLDGKGATLFIREESVSEIKPPEEEEEQPEKALEDNTASPQLTPGVFIQPHTPSLEHHIQFKPLQTSNKTEEQRWSGPHPSQGKHGCLDALYTRKWSGKTYFEEEYRNIRDKQYMKELNIAEGKRRVWKQFQKEIQRDQRRDLMKNAGPPWWQEPSRKQICLVTSLGDVIKADHEEGVTGRTRQWLLDLGVTTRVTPQQVRSCMKKSLLNPVDFLLEVHSVILKSQSTKKKGDLRKPFTPNERLLLTAVCVIHLPVLLTMLHFLLPPPTPFSEVKHIQDALFGDLEDERIRYSTPYMEPLPFRSKAHYHNWALNTVFMALLPSLLLDEYGNKRTSLDTTGRAISSMVESIVGQDNEENEFQGSGTYLSVSELLSHCVFTQRESLKSPFEESSEANQSFNRKLSGQISKVKRHRSSYQTQFEGTSGYFVIETPYATKTSPSVIPDKNNLDNIVDKNILLQEDSSRWNQLQPVSQVFLPSSSEENDTGNIAGLDSQTLYSREVVVERLIYERIIYETSGDSNLVDKLKFSFDDLLEQHLEQSNLQSLNDEIKELSQKTQLQSALKVLSELGDPLAQLPKLHTLPTIQRWVEIRRGKRRILSQKLKEELLRTSRGMWATASTAESVKGPKLDIPKTEERLLTWNKKKWLASQVKSEVQKFNSRLKQSKVDNSRYFFPAMLNHYDHGSKLNRNFRDLFFTYLPAREGDTFTYRPWKPNETRNSTTM
uniref:DUF4771 domain-containing protein n=1 Tax=Graphocephala atropunctata TaxID=36148 RepID=A0A1B6LCJ2_9HEMI